MSDATAADYAWFDEEFGESFGSLGFCLTFVRDLDPEEALRRLGVTPRPVTAADLATPETITAGPAIGGCTLLEVNGFAGTLTEVVRRLSAGTVTAAVFVNVNRDQQFVFAADGRAVTCFEPDGSDERWGDDPDRLLPQMLALGMPTKEDEAEAALDDDEGDDPIITALALAERATGVRVTRDHLHALTLAGSVSHLY
ncbi:hypothetical protein Sme01_19730 [Sphaerisporangium melleum]|uniref:Uncharacterized protein n=1 Tax=Sphaerisporangium melleum TaxID=321316 RepID=A0A917VPV5_9ACTN|nr:DUF6461 domain-containing protein [Sphaerisporangium melleum]GGL02652.1 hypothetical protein GCM10007964_50900 [Sphaerisporangium melleum]GII69497.1 hypothetical protein Sme01_19730 [Sphaerisporangium melleum]